MTPKWKNYTPQLDVWSTAAGATTPNLGDTLRTQVGRYLYLPDQRLVCVDFEVSFGGSGSAGVGQYIVSLPIPAKVSLGGFGTGALNNQHDRPLGCATAYRLFQTYETPVFPNISDTGPPSTNGQRRNKWVQFFAGHQQDSGASAVTSTNTTKAITFANTLVDTPAAADIILTPTNSPSNLVSHWWLTGLSTAGFTVNVNTDPGASGFHFDWKLRFHVGTVPMVVSDQVPWAFGTLGDGLSASLRYEPSA